jgi:uncharacterized membrane protein YdbT with pleckstrin-like domain
VEVQSPSRIKKYGTEAGTERAKLKVDPKKVGQQRQQQKTEDNTEKNDEDTKIATETCEESQKGSESKRSGATTMFGCTDETKTFFAAVNGWDSLRIPTCGGHW